ncbi:MAG: hypothetical protein Q9180_007250, partial [Flavoplaca navasiana]
RGYHYDCVIDQIPAGRHQSPNQWMTRKLLDLGDGTDANDLLIFYYGGHGRSAKTPDEGPCVFVSGEWVTGQSGEKVFYAKDKLDFTYAKKTTLDSGPADVLYLLDCCYAATAGIKPGKELMAACGVDRPTPGPSPFSFTAALVQELNHAVPEKHFLTAAQLYFKMLDKVHKGDLKTTPVHVEAMVGPQPRTSIFLAPLGDDATWNESAFPLSGANLTPLGHRRHDIHAMLHVRISNGNRHTLEQLQQWLTTHRPGNVTATGVSFSHAAPSFSIIVIFEIPIPAYYCLPSHPAISFMTFVAWPEPPQQQQPQQPLNLPLVGGRPGGGENLDPNRPGQARGPQDPGQGPSQSKGRGDGGRGGGFGRGRGGQGGGPGGLGEARSGNIPR